MRLRCGGSFCSKRSFSRYPLIEAKASQQTRQTVMEVVSSSKQAMPRLCAKLLLQFLYLYIISQCADGDVGIDSHAP
jgi:hypothetical protein